MSLFNQLNNPNKAVSTEMEVVKDFERRIPYWGYRTVNYIVDQAFLEFKDEIDAYLDKLFGGDIDDGNGDVLDSLITDVARIAEEKLLQQRTEHRDTIKSFDIRMQGDILAFEKHLENLKEKLADTEKTQESYQELVERDRFRRRKRS